MAILKGDWYHCPRCDFPNDRSNGCCSECGREFDEKENVDEPRCSICSGPLTYDEVDIGVGIQTGNYRCDCCGWHPGQDDEQYCSYANGVEV